MQNTRIKVTFKLGILKPKTFSTNSLVKLILKGLKNQQNTQLPVDSEHITIIPLICKLNFLMHACLVKYGNFLFLLAQNNAFSVV